jgi:anti-sigma regulatory factor (Ser/Thr protein kinase)
VEESPLGIDMHSAEAMVPNRPDSVPATRLFLMRLLNGWGVVDADIEDAGLLTSELMANAVRHGSGDVNIKIELIDGRLYVGVHDDGEALPQVKHPHAGSSDSRGLWIVQSVAHQWGTHTGGDDPGKTAWFTLTLLSQPGT